MVHSLKQNTRTWKFVGHKGAVHSLAVNPMGNKFATGSKDNTIRIWENSVDGISTVLKGH